MSDTIMRRKLSASIRLLQAAHDADQLCAAHANIAARETEAAGLRDSTKESRMVPPMPEELHE